MKYMLMMHYTDYLATPGRATGDPAPDGDTL